MAKSTARQRHSLKQSAPRTPRPEPPSFSEMLAEAVNKPGVISQAYFHFHAYSFMNQLLALFECWRRHIAPGPIHTFKGWLKLNRAVRRGEKAITLCMPVSWVEKKTVDSDAASKPGTDDGVGFFPRCEMPRSSRIAVVVCGNAWMTSTTDRVEFRSVRFLSFLSVMFDLMRVAGLFATLYALTKFVRVVAYSVMRSAAMP
jgi:hypothetical protein